MARYEAPDVEFEGDFLDGSSSKSFLFQGDYWNEPDWIPRSQSEILERDGARGKIRVRGWLAKKNGWE